jgi:hypothetical protein
MCVATRLLEQAVATLAEGPEKPSAKATRPAATLALVEVNE